MSVNKFLIGGVAGLVVIILIASLYFETSPLLWFVDTSPVYMFLRSVMVLMLVGLLITDPPRSKLLRLSLGAFSITLVWFALEGLMSYQMHMLDVIIFIEVSIILGIEALEYSAEGRPVLASTNHA